MALKIVLSYILPIIKVNLNWFQFITLWKKSISTEEKDDKILFNATWSNTF